MAALRGDKGLAAIVVTAVSLPVMAASQAAVSSSPPASPLVDGNCQEYATLAAERIALSAQVTLQIYQNADYVWFCYSYPDGSFATLDLELQAPGLAEPVNLHVSAQLGEWPLAKPELAPDTPESDRWWNAQGWTANPIWINGMDTSGEKPRYRFKNAGARELQLSKQRFGRGEWRYVLKIGSVKAADGSFQDLRFPAAGGTQALMVK